MKKSEVIIDPETGLPKLPSDLRWTVQPVRVSEVKKFPSGKKDAFGCDGYEYKNVVKDHKTDVEVVLERVTIKQREVAYYVDELVIEKQRIYWWGSATRDVETVRKKKRTRTDAYADIEVLARKVLKSQYLARDGDIDRDYCFREFGEIPSHKNGWDYQRSSHWHNALWTKTDELNDANILKRATKAWNLWLKSEHELAIIENAKFDRTAVERANAKVRDKFLGVYPPKKLEVA